MLVFLVSALNEYLVYAWNWKYCSLFGFCGIEVAGVAAVGLATCTIPQPSSCDEYTLLVDIIYLQFITLFTVFYQLPGITADCA